jgi:hypothetical protein
MEIYPEYELTEAIARSVSHSEAVNVEAKDPEAVIAQIERMESVSELACAKTATSEGVSYFDTWGDFNGESFRLYIRQS